MAASPFVPLLAPWSQTGAGELDGAFPFVRAGDGSRTLLVLPGFGDSMFPGWYPPGTGAMLGAYFSRYLDSHTVYLLSRPRGLPDGYTIPESADDHAALIEPRHDDWAPVDVVGVSMGGLIGQQLAARQPDLVDRLVLVDSAYRLGEAGYEPVQQLLELARARDWATIRSELARAMYADARQLTLPPFFQTLGRLVQPRPADPADVPISLEAILSYDGRADLAGIEQPTLVIGGSRDPYFTTDVMAETAEELPNGRLSLLEGGKHAAFDEQKPAFDGRVSKFLSEERETE